MTHASIIEDLQKDREYLNSIKAQIATETPTGGAEREAAVEYGKLVRRHLKDPTANQDPSIELIGKAIESVVRVSTRYNVTSEGIFFPKESFTINPNTWHTAMLVHAITLQSTVGNVRTALTVDRDGGVLLSLLTQSLTSSVYNAIAFCDAVIALLKDTPFANEPLVETIANNASQQENQEVPS